MEEYIGTIKMFGFNFTPRQFAPCNGQLMPVSSNQALFALLGTTFGGNGSTTFGLPDMQGRVPVGQGTQPGGSNYMMGQKGGAETITLTTTEMPIHTHQAAGLSVKINASNTDANQPEAAGHVLANAGTPVGTRGFDAVNAYSDQTPDVALGNNAVEIAGNVSNTGGSMPHENRMPFLVVNFCICTLGIFPSRE